MHDSCHDIDNMDREASILVGTRILDMTEFQVDTRGRRGDTLKTPMVAMGRSIVLLFGCINVVSNTCSRYTLSDICHIYIRRV